MTYLLVKERNNKFTLHCPEIYGLDTWGTTSQVSLEKKKKYWYISHWTAGNDYVDDIIEKFKLNVILETLELQKILDYIIINVPDNTAIIESILVQAQEIYHEYTAFEQWANSRNTIGD